MLYVAPHHLAIVREIQRRHIPNHDVFAFGSRTSGTARRYSDLDLAVITDTPLSIDVSGAMQEDFSESDLPFRVDLLDWALTAENFRRVVEANRILLQAANP